MAVERARLTTTSFPSRAPYYRRGIISTWLNNLVFLVRTINCRFSFLLHEFIAHQPTGKNSVLDLQYPLRSQGDLSGSERVDDSRFNSPFPTGSHFVNECIKSDEVSRNVTETSLNVGPTLWP